MVNRWWEPQAWEMDVLGIVKQVAKDTNHKPPLAQGTQDKIDAMIRFSASLDQDTHDEVSLYAIQEGISFTEAIRLLVEFGLEEIKRD